MSHESFYKASVLERMHKICWPHEWEHAQAAFDGDVEAAISLAVALSNDKRGAVAVAMWRSKVRREAFRAFFSIVWNHDHRHVITAAQTRRTLGYMFRYAAFLLPADLPEKVTVWRGSSHLPFDHARTGYSWSTDRDTACWFAMRFADRNGSPLVMAADIAKVDIALFTNDRSESEVVLIRPPTAYIDGDESDWTACYQRTQDARRAQKDSVRLNGGPSGSVGNDTGNE